MTRWTALDTLIAVAPFVVLAGIAVCAVRGDRRCICCQRQFPSSVARRRHEAIAHSL